MGVLSDNDHLILKNATRAAETKTSGEIFTVVAAASDSYLYIPILLAALVSLAAPLPLIFFTQWSADTIWQWQMVVFFILAAPTYFPAVRPYLVPPAVKRHRVYRSALEQFLAHNVHTTDGRTGVLIYVSLAEHRVELIADAGINEKVPQAAWQQIVDALVISIKADKLSNGLESAIEQCGLLLAQHFPGEEKSENKLGDHVVDLS